MHKLAIIADPHYHEVFPGHGFAGVEFRGREGAWIRTLSDSLASTRLFNEGYFAFIAALEACVAEGIDTILIAGDLTDDGQTATMDAALAILARYQAEHGIRFFLTPGNHDVYGMSGRHHSKVFYADQGRSTVTLSSDPDRSVEGEPLVYQPAMFCRSYPDTAVLWAPYGIQRQSADLHWECPFGTDDAFSGRMFEMNSPDGSVRHRQLDLSYLVEPEPGLWLVSIDANVFEPRQGCPDNTCSDSFDDSTDAGWNALTRLKPFLLDWLADVAARAKTQGKTLICFSHYPVLDTYDQTADLEYSLFGDTQDLRRTPRAETSSLVARTGIGMHFSGHLHVSDSNSIFAEGHQLTNIAVPSTAAFPPAFAVVTGGRGTLNVDNRLLTVEDFDSFFPFYRHDAEQHDGEHEWIAAQSYADFLYRHVRELVIHRYLPLEWPQHLAQAMQALSVADLQVIADITEPVEVTYRPAEVNDVGGLTGIDLVADWYAARKASGLLRHFLNEERLRTYRSLIRAYSDREWSEPGCLQSCLKLFFEMMERHLEEVDSGVASASDVNVVIAC